jgi:hypothetical protein
MKSFCQIIVFLAFIKTTAAFAPKAILTRRIPGNTNLCVKQQDYDEKIATNKDFLRKAAVTKCEDAEEVFNALEDLEKLMREKRKNEGEKVAQQVLDNLTGEWRLIFTTGTKKTQDRFKTKINYFPLKAIQAFDSTKDPMYIENAIYAGDFAVIKFKGDFEFSLKKSKVRKISSLLLVDNFQSFQQILKLCIAFFHS